MLENLKDKLNLNSKQQGIFHNLIYEKFKEKSSNSINSIIKRNEVRIILYNSHVPIKFHQDFLKEMQDFGLIKLKNKQNIEILKKE